MRAAPIVWSLWPGLPRLWNRGEWPALLVAISFGVLLNCVLLFTFVWNEVLPVTVRIAAWVALGGFWLASAAQAIRHAAIVASRANKLDDKGLFLRAQNEYLKQHWYEAEALLKECVQHNAHDVDARLMLASLYRRTKRPEMARDQLSNLAELPHAAKWHSEIRHELKLLERTAHVEN